MDLHVENYKKKSKCKPGENQATNEIQNIPQEIALHILSRLPITSLVQSRFVCKAWEKLTFDPNLVKLHLSQKAEHDPYLIFHSDFPIQNQLYFVQLSGVNESQKLRKIHTPFCASMPEFVVVGSCNGLLCLSGSLHDDDVFIYNPFTRDYKELPKSRSYQDQVVIMGFGYHPVINEYKVVKIIHYWNRCTVRLPPQSDVLIFSLSINKWRSIGKIQHYIDTQSSQPVVLNGRLHWMSRTRSRIGRYNNIVAFDLEAEQFNLVPKPEFEGRNRLDYHLTVLGGCLSMAVCCVNVDEMEIWIMKEYNVKESWSNDYKIGAFTPRFLHEDVLRPCQIWRNSLRRKKVRVLCVLKNGEILLEYKYGTLASYNPESGLLREMIFEGLPSMFQAVVHIGSLNWIDVHDSCGLVL